MSGAPVVRCAAAMGGGLRRAQRSTETVLRWPIWPRAHTTQGVSIINFLVFFLHTVSTYVRPYGVRCGIGRLSFGKQKAPREFKFSFS